VTGTVFNIMRFSTQDGPGIRTTVFLKGCPLACDWCHNPESQSLQPVPMYFAERCRHCGDCLAACPQHAIEEAGGVLRTSGRCRHCGTCADVCHAEARQLAGKRTTVDELIAEIEKDLIFFDESGGGVTLSGGEPLAQPRFVSALLRACRDRGVSSVLETCGYAAQPAFLGVALLADMVYFDLKLMDPERHRRHTGVANGPILRNLEQLVVRGRPVTVRIPVVPGINDDASGIERFADYLAGLSIARVELLPYHQTGIDKYRRLAQPYKLAGTPPPAAVDLERFRNTLASAGLNVTVGG
jgi:pyruvate formate lyase activating enzyme